MIEILLKNRIGRLGKVTLAYFSFLCVYTALRLNSIVVKLLAILKKKFLILNVRAVGRPLGPLRVKIDSKNLNIIFDRLYHYHPKILSLFT